MKKSVLQPPPKELSAEAKAIWRELAAGYPLEDPAGRHVLRVGLEAHDTMRAAQRAIAADGATTRDRWGQVKSHPLLSVERDARAQFMASMKALGFELAGRPLGGS